MTNISFTLNYLGEFLVDISTTVPNYFFDLVLSRYPSAQFLT